MTSQPREWPIIFSPPMVRAILDGNKTQTRRRPTSMWANVAMHHADGAECRLWVRETFALECDLEYVGEATLPTDRPVKAVYGGPEWGEYHIIPHYRATESEPHIVDDRAVDEYDDRTRWRPSIHMPRWASRLTLRVKAIGLERLQEISEADAADALYTKPGTRWEDNPEAYRIVFEVLP